MKNEALLQKHSNLLNRLHRLPRKIVQFNGTHNMSEFILHELSHSDCFNINKVAYFIDNPDFDCLKGIVGVDHTNGAFLQNIWDNTSKFTSHMKCCEFNQQVRSFEGESLAKRSMAHTIIADAFADELGIERPCVYMWAMKYNNNGLLLLDKNDDHNILDEDYLMNSAHLLSLPHTLSINSTISGLVCCIMHNMKKYGHLGFLVR